MKKVITIMLIIICLVPLTSCFSTRTELFNLHIEEDTYIFNENLNEFVVIEDNIISHISLTFKNLNKIVSEDDDFIINTFGDFSFQEIKLFEIEFYMGLNYEKPVKYDLTFKGRANPGRPNAYKFTAIIDGLYDNYNSLVLVLDINTNIGGADDKIGYLILQFKNTAVSGIGATVELRTEIENKREESLKILRDTFSKFKREDYEQEGWSEIYKINGDAREALNKALDIETISLLIQQALKDFANVPTIE